MVGRKFKFDLKRKGANLLERKTSSINLLTLSQIQKHKDRKKIKFTNYIRSIKLIRIIRT